MNKALILILMLSIQLNAKIRLLTFHYNRPDFIECQKKCLDKFLVEKDDYELIVFNDAPNEAMANRIQNVCDRMKIKCVRYKQEWHHPKTLLVKRIEEWAKLPNVTGLAELNILKEKHPSIRHCNVIQYALDHYGYDHKDVVGLLDGDMFLIRNFSIRQAMEENRIVGTLKYDETGNIPFFWVALSLIDMKNLSNPRDLHFSITLAGNRMTDSGGESFHYTRTYPDVPVKYVPRKATSSLRKSGKKLKKRYSLPERRLISARSFTGEFHMEDCFLHYLRSSFQKEFNEYAPETAQTHKEKSEPFKRFMNAILK